MVGRQHAKFVALASNSCQSPGSSAAARASMRCLKCPRRRGEHRHPLKRDALVGLDLAPMMAWPSLERWFDP